MLLLLARACCTGAGAGVALARCIVLRVIGLVAALLRWVGVLRTLKESSALCQNSLKCVYVLLCNCSVPLAYRRELDSGERPALWAQVPSRDEIAVRWLVVDLRRGREREVELGR